MRGDENGVEEEERKPTTKSCLALHNSLLVGKDSDAVKCVNMA